MSISSSSSSSTQRSTRSTPSQTGKKPSLSNGDPRALGFKSPGRPPQVRLIDETVDLVLARFNRGMRNPALRSDECVAVYKIAGGFVVSTREIRHSENLVGTYRSGITPDDLEADLHYALANN